MAKKAVLLTLMAFFISGVVVSYQKLQQRSVAYDTDVVSASEQLYPSFTLCPEYNEIDIDVLNWGDQMNKSLVDILKHGVKVFNELTYFRHYHKMKNG